MFYGHSRRHGLIVPNPDPQFGNQSEQRIARTRTGRSRVNSRTINWRKFMNARALVVLIAPLLVVSGCAATIHGTVQLVDSRQQPLPNESPKGAVVNMINTTAAVDQASSSATVVEKGSFFGKKVEFKLPKIQETKRKSIKGSATDEDKIINPGEVNIQPPAM